MLQDSAKKGYAFNIIACTLGWMAFGFGIASVSINNWINNGSTLYAGLLFLCHSYDCVSTDQLPGLQADKQTFKNYSLNC